MRKYLLLGCLVLSPAGGLPAQAQPSDLQQLSIEQLANVEITTVNKTAQPLSDAAAPAYVISHDDVMRSGAMSIPEMLRLAPNLEVMQTSPSNYEITSRGLNGNSSAQNFPDKLLVLIDGRSVYSPLYSGVYWDMQDVLPEDVERIEVVSGPGGTLWGANAVNGVINIVTRKSNDTLGGLIDLGAGNLQSSAAIQYGGKLEDDLAYRIYAKDFYIRGLDQVGGTKSQDGWAKPQGGFRLDWSPAQDSVTLQGDIYGGSEGQLGTSHQLISGGNLTAHWDHPLGQGLSLQTLAYYDQSRRYSVGNGAFTLNTFDLEVQHNFSIGSWNSIVWGGGRPHRRVHHHRSRFGRLVAAVSAACPHPESGQYLRRRSHSAGRQGAAQPGAEAGERPLFRHFADAQRAAVSESVRSPTPFDTDVSEKLGSVTFLTGNPDFQPEKVTAYELGYRGQFGPSLSFSLSLFDDAYDDLKSIEFSSAGGFPLQWGNRMHGDIYGLES